MFWDDFGGKGSTVNERVQFVLKRIRQIKAQNLISIPDGEELKILRKELEDIQKTCNHSWFVILLFHRHRRYCKWCDVEDYEYVHQD